MLPATTVKPPMLRGAGKREAEVTRQPPSEGAASTSLALVEMVGCEKQSKDCVRSAGCFLTTALCRCVEGNATFQALISKKNTLIVIRSPSFGASIYVKTQLVVVSPFLFRLACRQELPQEEIDALFVGI